MNSPRIQRRFVDCGSAVIFKVSGSNIGASSSTRQNVGIASLRTRFVKPQDQFGHAPLTDHLIARAIPGVDRLQP
jgi:hypothetical protein